VKPPKGFEPLTCCFLENAVFEIQKLVFVYEAAALPLSYGGVSIKNKRAYLKLLFSRALEQQDLAVEAAAVRP
jgi:hypothetical protein